jgi:hypothetical protein
MGNIIISVLQLTLLEYRINEDEIGGTCNIRGRNKKCNIILMINLEGKITICKNRCTKKNNVKIDLRERDMKVCAVASWFKIESFCQHGNKLLVSIKQELP